MDTFVLLLMIGWIFFGIVAVTISWVGWIPAVLLFVAWVAVRQVLYQRQSN